MKQVVLTLPDELVEQAERAGLFNSERLSEILQKELRRVNALHRFDEIVAVLHQGGMTEAEVEAELMARKTERLQTMDK